MSLQGVQALYPPKCRHKTSASGHHFSPPQTHTTHTTHTHTHTFFFDLKQFHPCLGHFQRNLASSPRNSSNSLLGLTWEDLNTVFSNCCTAGVPFGHRVKYMLRGYMLSNQTGTLWASSGSQLRPPARPEWQHHQCGSRDPLPH